jgi:ribonuclease HI
MSRLPATLHALNALQNFSELAHCSAALCSDSALANTVIYTAVADKRVRNICQKR